MKTKLAIALAIAVFGLIIVAAVSSRAEPQSSAGKQLENSDWRIRVGKTRVEPAFDVGQGFNQFTLSPGVDGDRMGIVDLEVQALRGETGRLMERLRSDRNPLLTEGMMQYLAGAWSA